MDKQPRRPNILILIYLIILCQGLSLVYRVLLTAFGLGIAWSSEVEYHIYRPYDV